MEHTQLDGPQPANDGKPHVELQSADMFNESGRDDNLLHPGIKSVAPATGKKAGNQEVKILNDVSLLFGPDKDEDYPYDELKIEQAFFVPVKPNETTDKVLAKIHKSIDAARNTYGEIEVDENGDHILEVLTIETRKRNEDGTVRLKGDNPILGASFHQRPKYIYTRNFIAKVVIAGQKLAENVEAEGDGVVVIRVA